MDDELPTLIQKMILNLDLQAHITSIDGTSVKVGEMYREVFSGVHTDTTHILSKTIPASVGQKQQLIVLSSISLVSMCEHHFLPFVGYVDLCYVVNEKIIGLGHLTRLVKTLMRRPQLQEKLTDQIAQHLTDGLAPLGVGVHVVARHFCEMMRGLREESQIFSTFRFTGELEKHPMYHHSFTQTIENTLLKFK